MIVEIPKTRPSSVLVLSSSLAWLPVFSISSSASSGSITSPTQMRSSSSSSIYQRDYPHEISNRNLLGVSWGVYYCLLHQMKYKQHQYFDSSLKYLGMLVWMTIVLIEQNLLTWIIMVFSSKFFKNTGRTISTLVHGSFICVRLVGIKQEGCF